MITLSSDFSCSVTIVGTPAKNCDALNWRKNLRPFRNLEVQVVNNDLEKAIRTLKRKVQKDGIFKRLKAKRGYEKPSECRRRKRRESERRRKKK